MEQREVGHLCRDRKGFVVVETVGDDVEHRRVYVELEGNMEVAVD
jgi:hypothetical protein